MMNFPHHRWLDSRGTVNIRTAASARKQLWYIKDETIRRNLAYAHIQADVLRWLLNRTDLAGTAKEMIIKEVICLAGSMAETITKQIATQEGLCGKKRSYNYRCDILCDNDAVCSKTRDELKWLWDKRQNVHIFMADDWEYGYYKMGDCNRAIRCLHSLKSELNDWYEEDLPF